LVVFSKISHLFHFLTYKHVTYLKPNVLEEGSKPLNIQCRSMHLFYSNDPTTLSTISDSLSLPWRFSSFLQKSRTMLVHYMLKTRSRAVACALCQVKPSLSLHNLQRHCLNRSGYIMSIWILGPRQADQLCLRSRLGKVNEFINDPLQENVHDGTEFY